MFTGLVEEIGHVERLERQEGDSARLVVRAARVTSDVRHGDSVAVDGVCLTVTGLGEGTFTADVMGETLARSTLGGRVAGDLVNLERAVTPQTRLGGHLVQGHVDGVGRVVSRTAHPHWEVLRVAVPAELARYVAEKGSVAVDGTSLTVSAVGDDWLEVSLIPVTLAGTTLGARAVGSPVNIEVDVVAKYVERLLTGRQT